MFPNSENFFLQLATFIIFRAIRGAQHLRRPSTHVTQ